MILNAKNNQFVFRLPKGFINSELETKYNYYLKRLSTPFENITDYVNHTIQSISFPGVAAGEVEQMVGRKTSVDGRNLTKNPQYWRQSLDLDRILPKEMTINFKAADGYLNYWVLFENFREYLKITSENDYLPDLSIMYLDRQGHQMVTLDFRQPLITNISDLEMNYSEAAMDFRTFSMGFKYNFFEIKVKTD